jgi:hypothetical protein
MPQLRSTPPPPHLADMLATTKLLLHPLYLLIHSMMMSIMFQAGFSPKCWWRIIDLMLEKQPGNTRIHRLQIIALMESDLNQAI